MLCSYIRYTFTIPAWWFYRWYRVQFCRCAEQHVIVRWFADPLYSGGKSGWKVGLWLRLAKPREFLGIAILLLFINFFYQGDMGLWKTRRFQLEYTKAKLIYHKSFIFPVFHFVWVSNLQLFNFDIWIQIYIYIYRHTSSTNCKEILKLSFALAFRIQFCSCCFHCESPRGEVVLCGIPLLLKSQEG